MRTLRCPSLARLAPARASHPSLPRTGRLGSLCPPSSPLLLGHAGTGPLGYFSPRMLRVVLSIRGAGLSVPPVPVCPSPPSGRAQVGRPRETEGLIQGHLGSLGPRRAGRAPGQAPKHRVALPLPLPLDLPFWPPCFRKGGSEACTGGGTVGAAGAGSGGPWGDRTAGHKLPSTGMALTASPPPCP